MRGLYENLKEVSWERITAELEKLMCGKYAAAVLDEYRDVFACLIPELSAMFGFEQYSPYHNRDVWHHTLAAVEDIPPVFALRMTMLLHDIAKPVVFVLDDNGRGRFVGTSSARRRDGGDDSQAYALSESSHSKNRAAGALSRCEAETPSSGGTADAGSVRRKRF